MNKIQKKFITADTVRNNALKLADKILKDGFVPDVIYVSLRGGAIMGNVISEYLKVTQPADKPVFYAAVVARSYTGLHSDEQVKVDGWTYSPDYLRTGDKILFVDDIFDTGKTLNHLVDIVLSKGIPRHHVRVAVHDYKVRKYNKEHLAIKPDYYCCLHVMEKPSDNKWIHYQSHEFSGLTPADVNKHYQDIDIVRILQNIL